MMIAVYVCVLLCNKNHTVIFDGPESRYRSLQPMKQRPGPTPISKNLLILLKLEETFRTFWEGGSFF